MVDLLPIETRTSLQPSYIVPCNSEREIQLARLAKPPFVRAEIIYRLSASVIEQDIERDVQEIIQATRLEALDHLRNDLREQAYRRRDITVSP